MPKRRSPQKDFEWTPQLAYAIGLLVTDGNLSKDARHITMRSAEIPMLEIFKKCLGIHNIVGTTRKENGDVSYRVQFSDVQFYDWLLKIGLFPAKSYTIGPIAVPDEFFRDYFRGCIDGDGNICTYQDRYNLYHGRRYATQRLFIRLVSASEKHIRWAQNRIISIVGIHGAIMKKKIHVENRVQLWELRFAKKESLLLIDWMYYAKDIPCLERKRATAYHAIEIIKQQKRRTYARVSPRSYQNECFFAANLLMKI